MFSMTTIELVTSVPTEVPSARSVNMLKVKPHSSIAQKETTMETGIEITTMMVDRTSWRNAKRISAVSTTPRKMLFQASSTEARMKAPESRTHSSFMPPGSRRLLSSSRTSARTASITRTALASPFLTILSTTPGLPSKKARERFSSDSSVIFATSRR